MHGDAFRVISDGAAQGRYFALFLSCDSDTALHRKLTFWKRHPDVARRLVIRVPDDVDVDALASALVSELSRRNPSLGHWEVRWLLRAGMNFGILVIQPEDSSDGHWPGLGFYGASPTS